MCLYYRRHTGNLSRDAAGKRKGMALAMMLSAQRRMAGGSPPLPPGLFDPMSIEVAASW
ncbi:MAG: hypothetical protein ABIO40_10805 [Devosia sp.]